MDIYVGNLPFNLDEQTVIDAFSEYGSVARFKMITDRETGRPRGFGFITMDDDAQAEAAINGMEGQEIGGRALRVNAAQQKSGGGGGGGRDRDRDRDRRY
ncbi:MAG: RNA-binding protein [Verrucomicrobiales bacterium]|nr:RNA-binding protein [Verrucomicrobiales bacterium]